jgi:serine/threonine-protein kinase
MDLPSELNPVITPRLDQICKKALSIDRDHRYRTAREMADDLVKAKEEFLIRLVAAGAPAAQMGSGAGKPPAVEVEVRPPRAPRATRLLE